MGSSIEIKEDLMKRAMEASGLKTKRAVVEAGLHLVISLKGQETIKNLKR